MLFPTRKPLTLELTLPLLILPILVLSARGAEATDAGLVEAVKNRDLGSLQAHLQQGAEVDLAAPDGTTALAWAAHWDDAEAAELLLAAGANPDLANDFGVTPLSLACVNRSAAMVERLLRAGADPNANQASGETVLMGCATTGNVEAVRWLIESGADVNKAETWKGQTALMWAATENHSEVVRLLVEQGADVGARTKGGFTALLFAAQQGALEPGRTLLDAGADINEAPPDGKTPLLIASSSGQTAFSEFLLERGADPNASDEAGYTALHYAAPRRNMLQLVRALLGHGADPNARIARHRPRPGGVTMMGATPLMLAAEAGNIAAMRALAEAGTDSLLMTKENTTLLLVALGVGQFGERSASDLQRRHEAAQLAVEMGSDVHAAGEHGWTAMHAAAYAGADETIQFLADRGAGLDVKDGYGQTPLSIASAIITVGMADYADPRPRRYRRSTVDLLLQLGATPIDQSGVEIFSSIAVAPTD